MSGGWLALLQSLPLLLDGYLVDDGGTLVEDDVADHRDLSVVQLRNVDVYFHCRHELFDDNVPDLWYFDHGLNSDSLLGQFDVLDHW